MENWKKYLVEVRANEFEYHPPHFHVSCNEFSAVFKMSDGNLYKDGKKKWTYQMVTEIKDWYETNKEELQEAGKIYIVVAFKEKHGYNHLIATIWQQKISKPK